MITVRDIILQYFVHFPFKKTSNNNIYQFIKQLAAIIKYIITKMKLKSSYLREDEKDYALFNEYNLSAERLKIKCGSIRHILDVS